MTKQERLSYIVAIVIAIFIASGAAIYKYVIDTGPIIPSEIPAVGKVGSDHAHASMLVMVDDRILNFCSSEFMLKSQYVHFENGNCAVVHRHAKGVTIPTFLKTIGISLTKECLTVPNEKPYCESSTEHLHAVVNGKEMAIELLPYYVFRNNDHILISYGKESGDMLLFKYNQVPQIPLDVNEPINNMPFGKILEEPKLENVK